MSPWIQLATEALRSLHWLPVKARAQFKILLFAYKIFHKVSNTPMYFQDQFYIPDRVRVTRSSSKNLLSCHLSSRLSTVGERSFFMSEVRGDYAYCRVPGTQQLPPLEVGEDNSILEPN